jgi:hypothetical protein
VLLLLLRRVQTLLFLLFVCLFVCLFLTILKQTQDEFFLPCLLDHILRPYDLMMTFLWTILWIGQLLIRIDAKWVRDVDSKIVDEIKQNPSIAYVIQFHAPWFVIVLCC